jgi:hypothetical protein
VGRLFPSDFDLAAIEHSERRTVEALLAGTGDEWIVLPSIPFVHQGRDGEVDVVVLNARRGALVIEVKGGRIRVRNGHWLQNDHELKRSPAVQARSGMYALLDRVRGIQGVDDVDRIRFQHAVAFPDVARVPPEGLGPDLPREMVLAAPDLEVPEPALQRLLRERQPVAPATIVAVVRSLRPTVELTDALGPQLDGISRRLDDLTDDMLRTAEGLDVNPRVWVEGPAGSGKSRLAIRWAQRAADRGERVLLLCFNKPMASIFVNRFEDDPRVVAGGFHDVALTMLEPLGLLVPEEPDKSFWDDTVSEALLAHRDEIADRFDTIILDEVQDIRPHWFAAIEALLDPDGAGRYYRLGDSHQNVYRVDGDAGAHGEGWVRFPLGTNCRNTGAIAEVAARVGGGPTYSGCPAGPPVRFLPVGGVKEARKRVASEVEQLRTEHQVPASGIAVVTTSAELRDQVLAAASDDLPLARWDDRDESAIVCETAHRLKGTEWQAVVLASLVPTEKEWLPEILYVGVSRATTWLSVVATRPTAALLGIEANEVTR